VEEWKEGSAGRLAGNLETVRARIAAACGRADRDPGEITIVAVTKYVGPAPIRTLVDLGLTHMGENRVQAAREKAPQVGGDVTWHMVGHLQRNKTKKALDVFGWLHSLDSLRLAEVLDKELDRRGRKGFPVLVQVNVAREEQKSGVAENELRDFVGALRRFERLGVQGLMTMAPFSEAAEQSRPVFARLRELREALRAEFPDMVLPHLSMGMTQDYEVAVEEGATLVRIGTALFRGVEGV
jgi:pyridoxal phosphate enzyme (YggS family)